MSASRVLRLLVLGLGACLVARAAAPRPPNVIVFMADDFGYECVTANGGESYATPNLDRLAATGMRFEQCHVQPLCTPTRVQLMTGLHNVRNYLEFGTMDRKAVTFGHLFQRAGYVTGICGKWQLGAEPGSAQHFGFDESFLWHHTRRASRYANPGIDRNGVPQDFTTGEYGPTLMNEFALDFITRHRERPFFLYYPEMLTHGPFQPTPDRPDYDRKGGERGGQNVRNFPAMVAYMDTMVGRIVAKLDALGLREHTLFVFLGDNGSPKEITSRFKGADYPGGKGTPGARGTHVPLIVNWPGRVPAGTVNRDLISSVDFLPTLCAAAGIALPPDLPPDGRSFWPQLTGQKGEPREWLYAWYAPDGGAKAVHEFARTHTYKLYRTGAFHDLTQDPAEKRPLAVADLTGEPAGVARRLQAVLDQYAEARPRELLEPRVTAKQAKKAEQAQRKKKQ